MVFPPPPLILTTVDAIRLFSAEARARGDRIALVPTMGYLHEGHLSLVRRAVEMAESVVVSIYVNPTQFGPSEDLGTYPRDLEGDVDKLSVLGVQAVFAPGDEDMYPPGFATTVRLGRLTEGLCGRSRPTHFDGVTTIVTKLFNLVRPDVAVFGLKDYQQWVVIRRMVRDLDFAIEVVGGPIVREQDGLAMSSRNAYLTARQRRSATALIRGLRAARERYRAGEREAGVLVELARSILEAEREVRVDYVETVDPDDLRPLPELGQPLPERVHMAAAAFVGNTRLIDNLRLNRDEDTP